MKRRNLAWKLGWYRQSELEGSLLLGRMVGQTDDPYLIEPTHEALRGGSSVPALGGSDPRVGAAAHPHLPELPVLLHAPDEAPGIAVRSAVLHPDFRAARAPSASSRRAADPATPEPARRAFLKMIEDEKDHLGWVGLWLKEQPGAHECLERSDQADRAVAAELLPYEDRHCRASRFSEPNPPARPANFTRRTTDLVDEVPPQGSVYLIALYHVMRHSGRRGARASSARQLPLRRSSLSQQPRPWALRALARPAADGPALGEGDAAALLQGDRDARSRTGATTRARSGCSRCPVAFRAIFRTGRTRSRRGKAHATPAWIWIRGDRCREGHLRDVTLGRRGFSKAMRSSAAAIRESASTSSPARAWVSS